MLPARVLELIDEQVVIARLQLQPAAREFFLAFEQGDRTIEHAGKIEDRMLVHQLLILLDGNRQHRK